VLKSLADLLKVTGNREPMLNTTILRKLFAVLATDIKVVISNQVLDCLRIVLCISTGPIRN